MNITPKEIVEDTDIVFSRTHNDVERITAGNRLIDNHIANKKYGALHVMALWRTVPMEIRERAGLETLNEHVRNGEWPRVSEMTWGKGLPEKVHQTAKERLGETLRIAIAKYVKEGNKEELFQIERSTNLPTAERWLAHDELKKLGGYNFLEDTLPGLLFTLAGLIRTRQEFGLSSSIKKPRGFRFDDPPPKSNVTPIRKLTS